VNPGGLRGGKPNLKASILSIYGPTDISYLCDPPCPASPPLPISLFLSTFSLFSPSLTLFAVLVLWKNLKKEKKKKKGKCYHNKL